MLEQGTSSHYVRTNPVSAADSLAPPPHHHQPKIFTGTISFANNAVFGIQPKIDVNSEHLYYLSYVPTPFQPAEPLLVINIYIKPVAFDCFETVSVYTWRINRTNTLNALN